MKSDSKHIQLHSFNVLRQSNHPDSSLENMFNISKTIVSYSPQCKHVQRERNHHTEQSSPAKKRKPEASSLPQIQTAKSALRLTKNQGPRKVGSKTVKFLDSLIDILKSDDLLATKIDNSAGDFPKLGERRTNKRPKFIHNQVTKKFLESKTPMRDSTSEQCSRTNNQKALQEFTFYGRVKERMKTTGGMSDSLMQIKKQVFERQ